ncbi:MAG: outer membrane beta-barrel protein, partial [Hyphomicrobiaceae bacterium]|nr:outer membrane beta-barrel protein [Hyphomicrobiaceae bacterium]
MRWKASWVAMALAVQGPGAAFGGEPQTEASPTTTTVTGGVATSTAYNDNIYARRTLRTPDGIFVVAPSLNIAVRNARGSLNFGGEGELSTYAANSREDTQDYKVYANGLYKFSPAFVVSGGASHERTHEDRASADEVFGDRPTIYWVSRANAASLWRFTGGSLKLGGTFDRFDFRDVNAGATVINNDDRDHDIATAGARLGFDLNSRNEVFANFTYDLRDYRSQLDDAGFDRDSHGVRTSAGWRYRPSANFDYEAYLGWIYQTHDDSRFKDISTLDIGHRMTWRPVAGTTLEGFSDRRVVETTLTNSSSYLQSASGLNIYHWPRPDIRLNAGASYYRNDYQDVDRVDSIWALNLGIRRYFRPNWYYGLSYNFTSRDSTDIKENYDRNEFMLRLVRQQTEAYTPGDLSAPTVAHVQRGGIYVGTKIGHTNTATKLEGPRENGTTVNGTCLTGGCLQADFGDHGLAGGVFGGYGVNIADWYVGAELDATFADSGWNHA